MTTQSEPNGEPLGVYPALYQRKSVRAFLPQPVAQAVIERILNAAARAPSGTNIQPWRVRVLTGGARQRLVDAVLSFRANHVGEERWGYRYYPERWTEPYLSRRRKIGWDMYALLGIGRGDGEKMRLQQERNFSFFDAPVGLVFSIESELERGSWLDYGMFIQSVALAAEAEGLGSCIQACWVAHADIVERTLCFAPNERLVCCMALGHADRSAPVNALQTERAALGEFVSFHIE